MVQLIGGKRGGGAKNEDIKAWKHPTMYTKRKKMFMLPVFVHDHVSRENKPDLSLQSEGLREPQMTAPFLPLTRQGLTPN